MAEMGSTRVKAPTILSLLRALSLPLSFVTLLCLTRSLPCFDVFRWSDRASTEASLGHTLSC